MWREVVRGSVVTVVAVVVSAYLWKTSSLVLGPETPGICLSSNDVSPQWHWRGTVFL